LQDKIGGKTIIGITVCKGEQNTQDSIMAVWARIVPYTNAMPELIRHPAKQNNEKLMISGSCPEGQTGVILSSDHCCNGNNWCGITLGRRRPPSYGGM